MATFVFCSSVFAQQPSLPQLPNTCTIVYSVIVRDLRSPEMRAEVSAGIKRSYEIEFQNGAITRAQADRMIKIVGKSAPPPQPTQRFTGRLSLSKGRFLWETRSENKKADLIFIWDGRQSYNYVTTNKQLDVFPGFPVWEIKPIALPGASLPDLQVLKDPKPANTNLPGDQAYSGDVPWLDAVGNLQEGNVVYSPGRIETGVQDGKLKIINATTMANGGVTTRWDFQGHRLFHGNLIASKMIWTSYEHGRPSEQSSFQMQSIVDAEPNSETFKIDKYLLPGSSVQDHRAVETVSFAYDPNIGDLDKQSERQKLLIQVADGKVKSGNIAGRSKSGLFLLLAFIFFTLGGLIWKRKQIEAR